MRPCFFFHRFALFFYLAALLSLAGCKPSIGDKCVLSTDCSLAGDRLCDTSQPGGYCTIFNCGPNSCPDYAACYLFHGSVEGCDYNDRSLSRTGRSFCMAGCQSDGDCRFGYVCRDARSAPWNAILLDDNQTQRVCIAAPDPSLQSIDASVGAGEPLVCQASPDVDAALPPRPDAGTIADAAADAKDGASDAGKDAGLGSADAGTDAGVVDGSTPDAAADATTD